MSSPAYVLSGYPISNTFRQRVSGFAGPDAQFVLLAELRKDGFWSMLVFLRSIAKSSAIYIPLEDEHSEPLLPVLLAITTASSAGSVFIVRSKGSPAAAGKLRMISAVLCLAISWVLGVVALVRSYCWSTWLSCRPQAPLICGDSDRIVYINANLWFGVRAGGSVGHVAGVANALADAGYEVDLASSNNQVMLRDAVRQHVLKPLRAFGFPYELNYFRYNFAALKQLRRLVAKGRCRFLYQRMSVMNFVGVILSRECRIPLVLEYNGSEIWIARNWGRRLRFSSIGTTIENICLRHAHRIVVVSRVLADELVERGVHRDRIVCYPNCVDPSYYRPDAVTPETAATLRVHYGIPVDAVVVAFVGTFGQWHGAPVLAAAIKELVCNESSWLEENKVRFTMIGDGLKMKEVKELIGGPEYLNWVNFTGLVPQAETVKFLAASDIFVCPHICNADGSRFFGSPTKLFEYMAMEKSIIASDLDQIGEVLVGGIRIWQQPTRRCGPGTSLDKYGDSGANSTAVLIRPGNVADLIAAIKQLVECPELRRQLAINARQELLRRYTWSHHVTQILGSLLPNSRQRFNHVPLLQSVR